MLRKFNGIIIDPELQSRMRLKQSASAVPEFGTVHMVSAVYQAVPVLNERDPIDVVFIPTTFEKNDIQDIIKKAKETKQGQDTAYILVYKKQGEGNSSVSEAMLLGGDGVLCEPYSVDQLLEITKLSTRIRKEREDTRLKIAIAVLLKDIVAQVDLLAYLRSSGCDLGTSMRKFREMCGQLQRLSPEGLQVYYKMAVDEFEAAPLPAQSFMGKAYTGASKRIRKKIEAKVEAEMDKISGTPGTDSDQKQGA